MLLVIATALIPALILGWWIYRKDSARPEPPRMLIKAFLYGVGSTFVSLLISTLLGVMGILVYDLDSFTGAVSTALFAAALPEETAKLLMLWLLLRKNPYYDEYLDGIVYAACVGLGFAATENVLYLLQSDDWVGTGIVRGLTAVPAHFAIACAMGYFYSKFHFGDRSNVTKVCILAVPILIHWIYDALAFSEGIFPALSVVVNVLFVLLIWRVYKSTMSRITEMQQQDAARMTPPPFPGGNDSTTPPPLPG
ncbi:MAG: PrsW family intramembrane metalloprotease [Muribaculaceae bacterium]|nr:PrsW family intramembrane metalloprotease [Muribaculaceae bacterium]